MSSSDAPSASTSTWKLGLSLPAWMKRPLGVVDEDEIPGDAEQQQQQAQSPASSSRVSGWFMRSESTEDLPNAASGSIVRRKQPVFLERALQYVFDSDSIPDKSPLPILLLGGVSYPAPPPPDYGWSPEFREDFNARVWCSYRSGFGRIAESGLCSDAGWGCMLRTGQSLLANALVTLHLGRDFRPTPQALAQPDTLETYNHIMSLFLDNPLAPFSVHNLAAHGEKLGKNIGEWFGPSTIIGSLAMCCQKLASEETDFLKLAIYKGENGTDIYESELIKLSCSDESEGNEWGDKAVLVLLNVRLGHENVSVRYWESLKEIYKFRQFMGIAGGRPASSYYFVGAQGDGLFYLDPHHTRASIPYVSPSISSPVQSQDDDFGPPVDPSPLSSPASIKKSNAGKSRTSISSPQSQKLSNSPSPKSFKTSSINGFIRRASLKASGKKSSLSYPGPPSNVHTSPGSESLNGRFAPVSPSPLSPRHKKRMSRSSSMTQAEDMQSSPAIDNTFRFESEQANTSERKDAVDNSGFYSTAYPVGTFASFHCSKPRKMLYTSMDPSMLLGFLIKSKEDLADFRENIKNLSLQMFSISDSPPAWLRGSRLGNEDMSVQSLSETETEEDLSEHDNEANRNKSWDSNIPFNSQSGPSAVKFPFPTSVIKAIPISSDGAPDDDKPFQKAEQISVTEKSKLSDSDLIQDLQTFSMSIPSSSTPTVSHSFEDDLHSYEPSSLMDKSAFSESNSKDPSKSCEKWCSPRAMSGVTVREQNMVMCGQREEFANDKKQVLPIPMTDEDDGIFKQDV